MGGSSITQLGAGIAASGTFGTRSMDTVGRSSGIPLRREGPSPASTDEDDGLWAEFSGSPKHSCPDRLLTRLDYTRLLEASWQKNQYKNQRSFFDFLIVFLLILELFWEPTWIQN